MPTLDATTSAAFAATGISADVLYSFLTYMWQTSLSFLIWTFKAFLPFWLVLMFIGIIVGLVFAIMRFRRG